jgi:hypothetical protein
MDKKFSTGIRPRRNEFNIRITQGQKVAYQDIISAEPSDAANIRRKKKQSDGIKVKMPLGLGFEQEEYPIHFSIFLPHGPRIF